MHRYRINGHTVLTTLDREQSRCLLTGMDEQGLLDCGAGDMHSVFYTAEDGLRVRAHILPDEISLIPQASF